MTPLPPHGSLRRRSVLRALGVAASRICLPGAWLAGAAARRRGARRSRADRLRGDPRRGRRLPQLRRRLRARQGRRRRADQVGAALLRRRGRDLPRPLVLARPARRRTRCGSGKIVYQPLTSTYRVTTVGGLSQNYPTRAEALAAISRGVALEDRRGRARSRTATTTSSSTTGSTPPCCRGRCRSASAASPTGSFRSSARCASIEERRLARRGAGPPEPAPHAPAEPLGLDHLDPGRPRRRPGARLPARRSRPTTRPSTSATTSGCSGSTSRWRARWCWSSSSPRVRLLWRVSRGRFGSRLLLKLAAIFALVGILPGVLIYTVSYQFVSRSIESWFDVKVEGALDAGLNLGRGTIDAHRQPTSRPRPAWPPSASARAPPSAEPLSLERLREQLSAQEIAVVGSAGQTLLATGAASSGLMPERRRAADAAPGAHPARRQPGRRPRRGRRRPAARTPRVRAVAADPEQQLHARRAGALPRRHPVARARPRRQRARGHQRLPRVPAARARPLGPAQDVHRHADAGAGARRVRRAAAGDRAQQPAGAAAAAARRGREPGGARRLQLEGGVHARATSSAA